jgi:hypothetical protein
MPENSLWFYGHQQEALLHFYGLIHIALEKTMGTIMENDPGSF